MGEDAGYLFPLEYHFCGLSCDNPRTSHTTAHESVIVGHFPLEHESECWHNTAAATLVREPLSNQQGN